MSANSEHHKQPDDILHPFRLIGLLHGLHGCPEEVHVEFFEFSGGKGFGEIVTVFEGLKFHTLLARQGAFRLLDFTFEFPDFPHNNLYATRRWPESF